MLIYCSGQTCVRPDWLTWAAPEKAVRPCTHKALPQKFKGKKNKRVNKRSVMAHGPRCPRSVRQETSSQIFSRLALPFSQKVHIMSSRSNSVTHSCWCCDVVLVHKILPSSLIPQPLTFPPYSTRACFILSCGRHRLNYGLKEAVRNTNPANNRNKDSLYLRLRKE